MKQEITRINLNGVNCYLGKQGKDFVLFDTGGHLIMDKQFNNRRDLLLEELDKAGCRPGHLKLIVLTHGDIDHAANAAFLRERYEVAIAMHSADVPLVQNPSIDQVMKNFHFKSPVLRIISLFMRKKIRNLMVKSLDDFESFTPDILLVEGDDLSKYGFDAEVIHIPGHTEGSIGILTASRDFLTGDTMANMKTPKPAPNASDFKILSSSLKKLKQWILRIIIQDMASPLPIYNNRSDFLQSQHTMEARREIKGGQLSPF